MKDKEPKQRWLTLINSIKHVKKNGLTRPVKLQEFFYVCSYVCTMFVNFQ